MASRIQGITVEIGGDTTKLSKALEGVNKTIKGTQTELKDVNKLLKLDPSNTELVVQKQKMLKDAIQATKEKLAALKTAAQQANEQLAKTKLGNMEWNLSTIAGVLANERHCGDVLARKTYTPNFLTHKHKKNNNDRTQYRQRDHHEAIVSREVFNAANHLRASRSFPKKNRPLPVLSVVDDGILRGYVPFDKDWTGFSVEEYREASESVMQEPDVSVVADVKIGLI